MFLKYCPDSLNHLFDRCMIKPCMGQVGEVLIHVFRFSHVHIFSVVLSSCLRVYVLIVWCLLLPIPVPELKFVTTIETKTLTPFA